MLCPFISSLIFFVQRELWRLELISKDPFSLYGRQILYVDPVTMLPVYKAVFDHSGRIWKVIITAFGLAAEQENGLRAPYPDFSIVFDLKTEGMTVLDYKGITYCDTSEGRFASADFDPSTMGPG